MITISSLGIFSPRRVSAKKVLMRLQ